MYTVTSSYDTCVSSRLAVTGGPRRRAKSPRGRQPRRSLRTFSPTTLSRRARSRRARRRASRAPRTDSSGRASSSLLLRFFLFLAHPRDRLCGREKKNRLSLGERRLTRRRRRPRAAPPLGGAPRSRRGLFCRSSLDRDARPGDFRLSESTRAGSRPPRRSLPPRLPRRPGARPPRVSRKRRKRRLSRRRFRNRAHRKRRLRRREPSPRRRRRSG